DLRGVLRFLDYVPDRGRAKRALDLVAPMLLEVVTLDPEAPGETHSVLDFAPLPGSLARGLFDEAVIRAQLDHLAAGQQDDGGWTFNFLAWSPAA
ncbi:MAG TPA: prenyltransferase, partial [Streptosporangiaceae bacterium]|nr:prenyltransferase [Streptosporangiaceae bacterium]